MTALSIPNPEYQIQRLDDGAVFKLTRPAKLNAITKPILLALADCITELETAGKKILIITADGDKAFCAGTDLAETQSAPLPQRLDKSAMARDLLVRLSRSRLISVAAINGLAFGGGLELAMACTFRIAATHASFSLPEIKLGLLPAYAGTQFLPALIGKARATELMLTGRAIKADEALAIGLITQRVDAQQLLPASLALAREVTAFSALAIDGIRHCVAAADSSVSDAGLRVEDDTVRRVFVSDDAKEGVAAFLEKRKAHFNGR